jgi:hypothetical protein
VGGISLGCELSNVRDATMAQQSLVFVFERAFRKFSVLAGKHLTPGFRTNGPSFANLVEAVSTLVSYSCGQELTVSVPYSCTVSLISSCHVLYLPY